MKVTPGYDPNSRNITLELKTNLLKKYYNNFEGMVSSSQELPKGTTVKQKDIDVAIISFPVPKNASFKTNEKSGLGYIAVDPQNIDVFGKVINKFVNAALRKEFRQTEFIPLSGYPIENLKDEIKEALKNKRNFCIIDTYENYLKLKELNYVFQQAYVEFGTTEYSKTAILINKGDIEGLRAMWSDKLIANGWN